MEKLVSSKGQIVPIRKRKSVYESRDKTEKEDTMPPPKPRVKQVVKKFKLYPTTLEKSTKFTLSYREWPKPVSLIFCQRRNLLMRKD